MKTTATEVHSHKHIVLGGDNLNSLSIIRSLGEAGIRPIAIIVQEGHIPVVNSCRFVGEYYPTKSIGDCISALLKYANPDKKPFVYTSDDNHESELDLHYDLLKDKFYFFNAGKQGRITHLMNKGVLCELARKNGFRTPKSEVVDRGVLPLSLKYPVFTKTITPYSAGWKRDVGVFHSSEELARAYHHMVSKQFLLQEYIDKKNELEIHGFSIDGGRKVYLTFCSLYYRFNKTSFGYYKYFFPLQDEVLRDQISKMVLDAHYSGVFEVEFLIDEKDSLVFLEINFRFALSNYACTYGGFNLPIEWAKATLSGSIPNDDCPSGERFSFMNEISDFKSSVRTKKVSFRTWLKELRKSDCLMLFHKNDPKPFFAFLFGEFKRCLKKKGH